MTDADRDAAKLAAALRLLLQELTGGRPVDVTYARLAATEALVDHDARLAAAAARPTPDDGGGGR